VNEESLWRHRDFRRVLLGQSASAIGNGLSFVVLPLTVLQLTHSGTLLGLLGLAQTFPGLVAGLFAGVVADRFDRRTVMIVCDAARAVLVALIPLSGLLGLPVVWSLYAVAVPLSALTPVFLASYAACVPALVGQRQVQRAGGLLQAAAAGGFVCGPVAAALLLSAAGPVTTLWIDAGSFAVSAASLLAVRRGLTTDPVGDGTLRALRQSLSYVRRSRLLPLLQFWACSSAANVLLVPAVAFYITQTLGLSSGVVALLVSSYSIGAIAGFSVAASVRFGRPALLLCGGNAVGAIALLTMLSTPDRLGMVICAGVAGMAGAWVTAVYVSVRTRLTPDRLLGRVSSLSELVTDGFSAVALVGSGVLLDRVGGTAVMAGIGTIMLLTALIFALTPAFQAIRATADAEA
jgi:MFS family permease